MVGPLWPAGQRAGPGLTGSPNVLGVSQAPTTTDTPVPGWTRTRYDNGSGAVQVEAHSIAGAGHTRGESSSPPACPPARGR